MSFQPDPLPLLLRAQAGDDDACELLLHRYRGIVKAVACRRLGGYRETIEDLCQVGRMGLLKAIQRYDPQREVAFKTYAYGFVDGEIRHHLRDLGHLIRLPSYQQAQGRPHPEILSTSVGDFEWQEAGDFERQEADAKQNVEEQVLRRLAVAEALQCLTVKQRCAIRLRYWQGLQVKEIAERMDTTSQAITNLQERALQRLKVQFERS